MKISCRMVAEALLCVAFAGANAQEVTVRVWWHGHHGMYHGQVRADLGRVATAWERGFTKTHPEVHFANTEVGDEAALGGLYTGVADIALMDRPPLAIEVDGYQQGAGHDPTGVAIGTGSLQIAQDAPALAIVVAQGNPLKEISLAQLDAVFDADHRRGLDRVHTWGDLGLTGVWANRPVHLYGFGINDEQSFLFERNVMKGGQKWREGLHEFNTAAMVSSAVTRDTDGIGIASMDGVAGVRVLAVKSDTGDAVQPTPEALRAGTYPLARTLYAYFNTGATEQTRKAVREILEYALSLEGQAAVQASGYTALSENAAKRSKEALQ
jgi:phosphate transport system substrate-binding protein